MKTLILIDDATNALSLFGGALAASFRYPASSQVVPACDVSPSEWKWADWTILGVSYIAGAPSLSYLETLLDSVHPQSVLGKGFAVFQVQARTDPPIAAAYGYALARKLRAHGMALLAPPTVFFRAQDHWSETEGELLRCTRWACSIVNELNPLSSKDRT